MQVRAMSNQRGGTLDSKDNTRQLSHHGWGSRMKDHSAPPVQSTAKRSL